MALVITVTPPTSSAINPSEVLTADVVGGDTWIAAQYDDASLVEVVHDGSRFAPRFVASVISAITGGVRYAVQRLAGWPGRKVTLRYYEMGGGGDSVAAPIVDKEQNSNSSGDEVVALQLPFDTDLCPTFMVVALAILGGSASGTATYRTYIGGAEAAADVAYTGGGTFVGQVTTAAPVELLRLTGSPFANPGGVVYLTITYESSGPGVAVTKFGLTGVVK
jgi:hypothetical protein